MVESTSIDQVAGQVNVLERHTPLLKVDDNVNESLIVGEVQLVLAEKRTSLAALRTGIAVLVLPLSVLSLLIATSRYYDFFRVLYLVIPLFVLNAALAALGAYLIVRAV
ncbi:MAG: hypothetical protein CVU64_10685, partial [Deltaproteobacteria bacterium HGW-Deltaproteobacteria-21]